MFLLRCLLRLLSFLPLRWLHALAVPAGWLLRASSERRRRVVATNLNRCFPALDDDQRQALAKDVFRHYAASALELGALCHWPMEKLHDHIVEVHGLDAVQQAEQDRKPILMAAPHFGGWEWLNFHIARQRPLAVMFKPTGNDTLDEWLVAMRSRGQADVLPTTPSGMRQMVKLLRQGTAVGILPDQEPSLGDGRWAPFLNQTALTAVLLPRLAARVDAEVFFCVARRLEKGRGFAVHFLPAPDGLDSDDLDVATAAVNAGVEACIALDPAQYLWTYKRFRHQPEGRAFY